MSTPSPRGAPAPLLRFLAAALVCGSAIALYGVQARLVGYALLAAGLIVAACLGRGAWPLLRHLALIGASLVVISLAPLKADLSNEAFVRFSVVLSLAVLIPLLISRHVLREDIIRFPRGNTRWSRFEWTYLAAVIALGYLVLPVYFIGSGAYRNWPTVTEFGDIARLFVGVNAVGLWDEVFFICTVFALLRRHFSFWQANALQATVFVSFLWELGYRAWGPALTLPFALLQGYIFSRTKSFVYVLIVHLSFDVLIWMILIHAHTPQWFDIFVTSPR